MLRPMWPPRPPAHAPPSPMHLESPAICRGGITATADPAAELGPSCVQETRIPVLPEDEPLVRASYNYLMAQDERLQELAGQCEAEAIELPCPQRLVVRVLAASAAAHAQALAAVHCFLRYYRPGLAMRLRMVPCAHAAIVQAELGRRREEEEEEEEGEGKKGAAVHAREGGAPAPARLYPVLLFACAPQSAPLSLEDEGEAGARVDKAVKRLETALQLVGGGAAFLPESATMVVSPWGNLDPPQPPTAAAVAVAAVVSGAGGDYQSPTQQLQQQYQRQQQQQETQALEGIVRRVVPGRGTTYLLPTPPPTPLLDSLRLLRECFFLELHSSETPLQEGHDFFQAWALASLGSHEQAGLVRERVAATIAGRGELMEEAEESVRRALGGGSAQDHLLRITNDMSFTGGVLEVTAAATYENVRILLFDVDGQRLSTLAPPAESPLPVTREAGLLHFQGAYWLLQAVGGEMDTTMTTTMAVGGGGSIDLDASMLSASQRMSEL